MALKNSPSSTRFITNKMCPFAQKAWIALECSQTPYELEEISLYESGGKPDWFWKLNPKGTVPVLVCNGGAVVLPDSDLILDVIEKGKAVVPINKFLYPPNDNEKELEETIKRWRKRVNEMLPVGKKAVLSGKATADLQTVIRAMDNEVGEGPYLAGAKLTTADCHAFPFLWRLDQEFGLEKTFKASNLAKWVEQCSTKEPRFQKTIQSSWWWWW